MSYGTYAVLVSIILGLSMQAMDKGQDLDGSGRSLMSENELATVLDKHYGQDLGDKSSSLESDSEMSDSDSEDEAGLLRDAARYLSQSQSK